MWEPIFRKFEAKLNIWNQRKVSMAGRTTLINSVLTALPLFYLSFFRAPPAVIKRLTSIQRNFLWGGGAERKKIAWVAWDQVCMPRDKGGLGIKAIKDFNRALLIKWKWHLFQQSDQFWNRILLSKYNGWRGLEEATHKQHHSFWWSDLKSVMLHSSMAGVLNQFQWRLGRGDQILFWEDSWLRDGRTLRDKYPDLYQITSHKSQLVGNMGFFGEEGWQWQFSWRRNLFDNELGSASEFIDQISAISPIADMKDCWVWGADPKGTFTTSSAYLCIKGDQPSLALNHDFNQLWEVKAPPRALTLVWRLLWDRLPTKENLLKRQVPLDNDLCPFCQNHVESASHLFFTCIKIMPLWWEFNSWVKEARVLHCRPVDNFTQHFSLAVSKASNRKWRVWWIAAIVSIWYYRNDMIFNNQQFSISKLVDIAILRSWSWLRGWEKGFAVPFQQWSSSMSLAFT